MTKKTMRTPYSSGGKLLGYIIREDMTAESAPVALAMFGRWHFTAYQPDGTKVTESNDRKLCQDALKKAAGLC